MLGKIITALAGRAVGRSIGGRQAGTMGALAGAALPMVLRRFGPLGMIGAAVGGYAFKKYANRRPVDGPGAAGRDVPRR